MFSTIDAIEPRVADEQTKLLYRYSRILPAINAINAAIAAAVLWPVVAHRELLAWLLALCLLSMARYRMQSVFQRREQAIHDFSSWRQRYLIGTLLSSVFWGYLALGLFPPQSPPQQIFIAFIVGGMAAGAITVLALIRYGILLFAVPAILPIAGRFWLQDDAIGLAMAVLLVLFVAALVHIAQRLYADYLQAIRLRIDNAALNEQLAHSDAALQAEQKALKEADQSYRRLFELASEGIYLSSTDGRQLRANPALVRLNGYTSEAEMLTAVNDIASEWYVDPTRRAEFKRLIERNGRVDNFISEIYRHKTRERIWISENAHIVRDDAGNLIGYEGTVRDITSLKEAEQLLIRAKETAEQAARSKSAFLATMTHELRTPMAGILGMADMLEETELNTKQTHYLGILKRSGDALLRIINDILDYSRLDSGRFALQSNAVDVAKLLSEAREFHLADAERKGLRITVEPLLEPNLMILSDNLRLRQILRHFMDNAVKFTHHGAIAIAARLIETDRDSVLLRLQVQDSGIGISNTARERLFHPFSQVDDSISREFGGTGIGLAICKRLA
ncbi:MAG: histidine kinase dimerization/phospho-acceptor domain-containing protein, partial [Gammaproteobacteria bacterium]